MKVHPFCRLWALILTIVALCPVCCAHAVSVSAETAVLLCAETGEVVYEKQAHLRRPMASTTKIMTALLTLEEASPQRVVTVTPNMVAVEGTSMGLLAGDAVSYSALVCGMLLSSGNDAANTAAIAIAGSTQAFAERMNARAQQIGMTDTHFVTPSGLDDEAHYSTAYDMALLACEALRDPRFADVCARQSVRSAYGNPPYMRTLTNHNRLLRLYPECVGVKTGFTKKSGRCLVSAARRGGVTLIAVTLHDPDDWNDHIALFEYGFAQVRTVQPDADFSAVRLCVTGGTAPQIGVTCVELPQAALPAGAQAVTREVFAPAFLYAPVHRGDVVGRAVYTCGGRTVCSATLLADADVPVRQTSADQMQPERSAGHTWIEEIKGVFAKWHRPSAFKSICPPAGSHPDARRRS